jgi:hypothetical protein
VREVQQLHEQAGLVLLLWNRLGAQGKRHITLTETAQYGPAKLRKAQTLRTLMDVLTDHYQMRRVPEGAVKYAGKARREAWEVRL